MSSTQAGLMREFRVVRLDTGAHFVQESPKDQPELDVRNHKSSLDAINAENAAYRMARNFVAATERPALVVGRTGAFVISVGTYPQDRRDEA